MLNNKQREITFNCTRVEFLALEKKADLQNIKIIEELINWKMLNLPISLYRKYTWWLLTQTIIFTTFKYLLQSY